MLYEVITVKTAASGLLPRYGHTAVWTGSEMIVWGGVTPAQQPFERQDGARYDPATDTWSPLSLVNAPSPRYYHTAVWTGAEMIRNNFV